MKKWLKNTKKWAILPSVLALNRNAILGGGVKMQNLTKRHAQTQKKAIGSPEHNGIKKNVGVPLLRVPLKHFRGYVWCKKAKKMIFLIYIKRL